MNQFLISYSVGPLLYCPAPNKTVSQSIIMEKFGKCFSLALCLEDTVGDGMVAQAEEILLHTMREIWEARRERGFYLPKIFIRVRNPAQITSLYQRIGEAAPLLTGFIAPKFALDNASLYIEELARVNRISPAPIYMMPILESPQMLHLQKRHDILYGIKELLDAVSHLILNVRVGGNDLCHAFGFRRQYTQTIYDIGPVANILSDIMTVFGMDYLLSGPVFEYYNGPGWKEGLEREIRKDRLNGFVGKTVIHPKQIEIVNQGYRVSRSDFDDAAAILDWESDSLLMVSGNGQKGRMNEYKTHYNWARRIQALYDAFGMEQA